MSSAQPWERFPPSGLLPVRPAPRSDESFLSWTTRLAIGNGLDLADFMDVVHQRAPEKLHRDGKHSDQERRAALSEVLARASGNTRAAVRALTDDLYHSNVPIGLLLIAKPPPATARTKAFRTRLGRFPQAFCPDCLAESFHLRRAWNLAFACVCPIHRRLLIEHCPRCGHDLNFTEPAHHRWRRELPPGTLHCYHCHFDLRRAKRQPAGLPIDQSFMEFLRCLLVLAETPSHIPPARAKRRRQTLDAVGVQLTLIRIPSYRYNRGAGMRPYYVKRRHRLHRQAAMDALKLRRFDPAWSRTEYSRLPCEARYVLLRMAAWLILNWRGREALAEDYTDGTWHGLMTAEEKRLKALGRLVNRRMAAHHARMGDVDGR